MRKLLFTLLLGTGAVRAEPALPEEYRQFIERGIQVGVYRDVAAGWIEGDEHAISLFGQAQADSAFETGAVSEVFTGLLLAQAVYEGKLRLQTSIRDLMPANFVFTDPALGALALETLAMHGAGLPPSPPNLMPGNVEDPYADYSESALRAFLANYRIQPAAEADYAYSPLDAGLLGYLLGRSYAANYADLLADKVLTPLGLKHTGIDVDATPLAGHTRGQLAPHWHFGVLAGSAGLRSTVGDLLDFLQTNLRPEKSPLRAALLLARQPRKQSPTDGIALGWNIHQVGSGEQTWPLLWRASSTAGFSTFIGFRTDRQRALVLLGNTDADLSALGMAALDGRPPPPLPSSHTSPSTPPRLAEYPGLYQVRSGTEVTIRLRDNMLFAQVRGQPSARLYADGDDVFDAGAVGFSISFQREAGKVTSLLLTRAAVNFLAQRLSERAPHIARATIEIDANALDDYTGDYRLDADMLARIAVRAGSLGLQTTGGAPVPLVPYARDHFACADDSCVLAFQRDAAGKISGVGMDFAGMQRDAPRVHWAAP